MLYLSKILQQSVWNEIKRHGKLGEDSGAMLLDFTSIRRTRLVAVILLLLFWILSVTPGTDRPRRSGFTQQQRKQETE